MTNVIPQHMRPDVTTFVGVTENGCIEINTDGSLWWRARGMVRVPIEVTLAGPFEHFQPDIRRITVLPESMRGGQGVAYLDDRGQIAVRRNGQVWWLPTVEQKKPTQTCEIRIALGPMAEDVTRKKRITDSDISALEYMADAMPDRDVNLFMPGLQHLGILKRWYVEENRNKGGRLELVIELDQVDN